MKKEFSKGSTAHPETLYFLLGLALLLSLTGCGGSGRDHVQARQVEPSIGLNAGPCAVALAPHTGHDRVDAEISQLQQQVRQTSDPLVQIERLGWMFVSKARQSYDPGYFKLAEECALCLESKKPHSPEALLLRGHALHNLHRFKESEQLARELVSTRGIAFDYGLLGDVLMEQGHLDEAIVAYQKMLDLRPDLQSYSRAAHMRWLKGDLEGALELMRLAARAGSPRDPDSTAWAYSQVALYELQKGDTKKAMAVCQAALNLQNDYAPALLVRGRILLAENRSKEAIDSLQRAANLNPLPEYHWTLAEALRADGRLDEANAVEAKLLKEGAASDPRTLALYLATRGEQTETALNLARQELQNRADVFTLDALAWALAATGKTEEARAAMKRALAEGTEDARLYYHAGVIAAMAGQKGEAHRWLNKSSAVRQMLLPDEREQLQKQIAAL